MRSTLDQFPLPWVVQERSTCFVVHDKTSQPLAYIHFEDQSGRLSPINQLTRDEALCIAVNIAKLPTETLRPAVPDAHQPSCFGLEEERGANWKGSGGAAPKSDFRNPDTGDCEASLFEIKQSFRHNTKRKDAIPNALQDLKESGTFTMIQRKTGGRDKWVYHLEED